MARRRDGRPRRSRIRYLRARHRGEKAAPHSILATLIGAAAVALPFLAQDSRYRWNYSALEYTMMAADYAKQGDYQDAAYSMQGAGYAVVDGVVNNFLPIIGLAALGAAVSWAGKKFGKSATNVSKKWRVF
jgi:hypothetical protein